MLKHHEDSIQNLITLMSERKDVLSIIIGGSLAKGMAKPDSDIDAMVILTDAGYQEQFEKRVIAEGISGHCTYEHGYFDIKYFTKKYLAAAAQKGSEPTRNSFVGAEEVYSRDAEIAPLVAAIGAYPVHEKQQRIESFFAGLALNRWYFWGETKKREMLYLKTRTAADTVYFGLRMVLAYNEILFPCHKWLFKAVSESPQKPDGLIEKAQRVLQEMSDEAFEGFCEVVVNWHDWDVSRNFNDILYRYIIDNEQWWYYDRPFLMEW